MYVLGLTGAKGCGKSALAEHLVEEFGFIRLRLADTMKTLLRVGFGLSHEQVDGSEKEIPTDLLNGHTPRWAMQSIGTEWGRTCMGEDFWMSMTRRRILQLGATNPEARIVVDDIRFPNEAEMILQLAGEIWRVRRPAVEPEVSVWQALRIAVGRPGGHASEIFWRTLPAKHEIVNDRTLEQFLDRGINHLPNDFLRERYGPLHP